jgi:hypothetical protein
LADADGVACGCGAAETGTADGPRGVALGAGVGPALIRGDELPAAIAAALDPLSCLLFT